MSESQRTHSARALVLSGGSGTRLWPLSRECQPKQFHDLTKNGAPLLVNTVKRLEPFFEDIRILTTQALSWGTQGVLKENGLKASLLTEPMGRNTAAAAYLACFQAQVENYDGVIALFSADHVIRDADGFRSAVTTALECARQDFIVTLGIKPTYASTAYGYIETESGQNPKVFSVRSFIEKPDSQKAESLIQNPHIFWNAGIFFFKPKKLAKLFEAFFPELPRAFSNLKLDFSNLEEIYSRVPQQSLDKAVMEKLGAELKCIPADMGWTDVGSWEEVAPFFGTQNSENVFELDASKNTFLNFTEQPRKLAVVGEDDLIVVDTQDVLLILKSGEGQKLKSLVDRVKTQNPKLIQEHSFETRPWGKFEVLRDEAHYKSKKITVLPGQKLSYQSHKKRAENWVIIKGEAQVTLNEVVHTLKRGESIFIPQGAKHRMANHGTQILEFIEVQTGEYFGEDDIIRYSDDYGRG